MKSTIFLLAAALPMFVSAQVAPAKVALHAWANGLDHPVWVTHADDDRLFVVEQGGTIRIVTDSMQVLATPFLDISSEVNSNGNEQGLLGLAFDPDYADNGYFYVYYIHGPGSGSSRISRFQVSDDPDVADPGSEVILFTVAQPFTNHNGGCLQFGPDGYLYCAFGDGGDQNDPYGNGQNLANVLGDMIRIDISAHDSTYLVPPDNPWATAQDTLPEIWASGLRNPWRYSFDRLTGDLWIGDVGQNAWEEVDFWPAGDDSGPDFGWRCREGLVPTPGVSQAGCGAASDYVDPVGTFSHGAQSWCAIIGGSVYRGTSFPHLYGRYIFTDYCAGDFVSFGAGYATDTLLLTGTYGWSSIGEDLAGDLYVTNVENGTLKKITDACPMAGPTVVFAGGVLTSSPADSYQWLLDGVSVPGATEQNYTPVEDGAYMVQASYGTPCTFLSDTVQVINTGIAATVALGIEAHPLPADQTITLRAGAVPLRDLRLVLTDAQARPLREWTWPKGRLEITLSVADLSEGPYFLRTVEGTAMLPAQKVLVVH